MVVVVFLVADGVNGVEIFVVIVGVYANVWQREIFRVNHLFGIPQWIAAAMAPHFFRLVSMYTKGHDRCS